MLKFVRAIDRLKAAEALAGRGALAALLRLLGATQAQDGVRSQAD
jgi:hypothetical protein